MMFVLLVVIIWAIAAWLTSVIMCLKTGSWKVLIAGAIFFPVACIHGTGIWFGAFNSKNQISHS
jgi:hypothetical protein